MENYTKCSRCRKPQINSKFEKFKNGKVKKVCLMCSLMRKKKLKEGEKIYFNLKKVHNQLHKHFKAIKRKEYIRKYINSKLLKRYKIATKTMENKKILLNDELLTQTLICFKEYY